jgi:hypothetical protein
VRPAARPGAVTAAADSRLAPTAQPPSRWSTEEELLGQVDVALEERGPSALHPLDLLTPAAWDVRD